MINLRSRHRYLPAAQHPLPPLRTSNGLVGVLGVRPKETGNFLTSEQRQTFAAFTNQAALAIERAILAEQAQQAELLQATEKLQTALLNSISHDLRTPLVSITGALTSLDEQSNSLNEENPKSLDCHCPRRSRPVESTRWQSAFDDAH